MALQNIGVRAISGRGPSPQEIVQIFHEMISHGRSVQDAVQSLHRIFRESSASLNQALSAISEYENERIPERARLANEALGGRVPQHVLDDARRNVGQPDPPQTATRFPPGTPASTIIAAGGTQAPQGNLPCLTKVKIKLRLSLKIQQVPRLGLQLAVKVMRRK